MKKKVFGSKKLSRKLTVIILAKKNIAKINLDTCNFLEIYFPKASNSNNSDILIVKEFSDAFKGTLPGLPPNIKIEHKFEILEQYFSQPRL